MKKQKTQLEIDLDERVKEIGFPLPEDKTVPTIARLEIAKALAQFYHGDVLYVDRRTPGHLKIYSRPGKLPS